jgi:CBS-domain-containing membrane protein
MTRRHEVDDRDWLELAQATKVKDLLAAKPQRATRGLSPVLVDRNTTIEDTLQLLKENNILSVPVVDMSGCHKGMKVDLDTFDGFVDVLDILAYLLWHMRMKLGLVWLDESDMEDAKEFFRTSISEVVRYATGSHPIIMRRRDTIAAVVLALRSPLPRSVPHRVAVLDDEDRVADVLTQSDLISFFARHSALFPSLSKGTLKELNLLQPCVTVHAKTSFTDALRLLHGNRVSGIAIVDDNWTLCACFSASDLRGITVDSFRHFDKTVLEFVRDVIKTQVDRTPISCGPDTTVGKVTELMTREGVHRVFVVDAQRHPWWVVSMTDIVARLV